MFWQFISVHMGTVHTPLLANLFLYSYVVEFFLRSLKSNKKLAKAFNLTSCYIDDLINIFNSRFKQFLKDVYAKELVVSGTSESRNVVSYLDLLIDISNSMLAERLFKQGFSARKLMRTFYKFMGRYLELASKFNKSPSSMIWYSIPVAQLYHTFPQLME